MVDEHSLVLHQIRDAGGAERVWLERGPNGDLRLTAHTTGRAVEFVMGDGADEYARVWAVSAEQVPDVLRALGLTPTADDRTLLGALRGAIGSAPGDEGTTIADRFITWLDSHRIPYRLAERIIHNS